MATEKSIEKIISLCKRRGFVFPGSEIYGGLANAWDYGPLGIELKNNIKARWWKTFVQNRADMFGLDAALLMNTKVYEASGHLKEFSDPLIECKACHARFRADELGFPIQKTEGTVEIFEPPKCPNCGKRDAWAAPKQFNLMLKTHIGPVDEPFIKCTHNSFTRNLSKLSELPECPTCGKKDAWAVMPDDNDIYFRPETAQGIFVNFKNIIDTMRPKLPFGVAQIGKAFRNEITPGNFIFRTREFEQMEIEYFIKEANWQESFETWRLAILDWIKDLGIKNEEIHELEVPKDELAHYSKRTIDFEYKFPFGQKELYGLAYRTDFDLKNHQLDYTDSEGNKFTPHVIEPSLGVDRSILAVLCSAYTEEQLVNEDKNDTRTVLRFPNWLAPVKIAVFPLLKNKPELVSKAQEIFDQLKTKYACDFDDNGNVGKRYRRQDEIGTPYCLTIDFDTLEKGTVTVRDRDTMQQETIKLTDLDKYFKEKL